MLLRSMQYTKELADAKAGNDALRDDAAGRRRYTSCQPAGASVALYLLPGVDNAAPRLADTAERDYFTLSEEADRRRKNNWKEPRSILMSSAELPISMGTMQLLWAIHTRFQRSINA